MRTITTTFFVSIALLAGSSSLAGQNSTNPTDFDQLKSQVAAQQRLLEQQQAHIQALESALADEHKMLVGVTHNGNAMLVPAVHTTSDVPSDYGQAPDNPPMPADQQPTLAEQEKVEEELQRGPEIADVTPATPALKLGPAKVRLIGYPAMTTLWRSTNSGGNVGTSFANIPFDNTVTGNTSEFRVSPQSTRLAIRVDADLESAKAAGYFEMDFGGSPNAGNIAVTSPHFSLRNSKGCRFVA